MFGLPIGPLEILVILVLALLIFGRRLPEVGRSVGKSIVEFKKGLSGMEEEIRKESSKPAQPPAGKHLEDQSAAASVDDAHNQREKNPSHPG